MSEMNNKLKALVVEDDRENQAFLVVFLKRKFEVAACDSAETFYERLNEAIPDLIIMDISLRGNKDGLQLTREIRENPETKDIIIVSLSAYAFQRDRENALRAGVDVFLTKPIPNHALYDAIRKVIQEKRGIDIGEWRKRSE